MCIAVERERESEPRGQKSLIEKTNFDRNRLGAEWATNISVNCDLWCFATPGNGRGGGGGEWFFFYLNTTHECNEELQIIGFRCYCEHPPHQHQCLGRCEKPLQILVGVTLRLATVSFNIFSILSRYNRSSANCVTCRISSCRSIRCWQKRQIYVRCAFCPQNRL